MIEQGIRIDTILNRISKFAVYEVRLKDDPKQRRAAIIDGSNSEVRLIEIITNNFLKRPFRCKIDIEEFIRNTDPVYRIEEITPDILMPDQDEEVKSYRRRLALFAKSKEGRVHIAQVLSQRDELLIKQQEFAQFLNS